MTVPIPKADQTWLHMDRPNNLMYVHGLVWFSQRPDWDAVEDVLRERLIGRFPVFGRRAAEVDGGWVWQDDPDFSLDRHVRRATLAAPGGLVEAERYVSGRMSQPFDRSRPLWEMDFIEGLRTDDEHPEGAILLARFHHGIADGVRLVQLLLGMLDHLDEGAAPGAVGRSRGSTGPLGLASAAARTVVGGTADFALGVGRAAARAGGRLSDFRPPATTTHAVAGLRRPDRLVEHISEIASTDNTLVNTWRSIGRLALAPKSSGTPWSGTPGVEKRVAWITGLPLEEVRAIGRAHGVTINDVLLSAVSMGVTGYLAGKGVTDVDQLSWLIPVSLKPIDAGIPEELGNHFAVVNLPMPLGVDSVPELLRETHSRMERIKNSAEPALLAGVQRVVAETPATISVALTNFVSNKSTGIITNVPGPRGPMALAGTEVSGILGFVPASGDMALGLCIFSYNGGVSIGIAADAGLLPDPDRLAHLIETAVHDMAGTSS